MSAGFCWTAIGARLACQQTAADIMSVHVPSMLLTLQGCTQEVAWQPACGDCVYQACAQKSCHRDNATPAHCLTPQEAVQEPPWLLGAALLGQPGLLCIQQLLVKGLFRPETDLITVEVRSTCQAAGNDAATCLCC